MNLKNIGVALVIHKAVTFKFVKLDQWKKNPIITIFYFFKKSF